MLHSLGVLQLPMECGTASQMECGTTSHWNADNFVIYSHPQCIVTLK